MKIVLLTKKNRNILNSRININFLEKLSRYSNLIILPAFVNKNDEKKLLVDPYETYEKYKPDVIMCHAQTPLLNNWFKKDLKCLKVIIAVDFYKIIQKNRSDFYTSNNFDLVIHRSFIPNKHKKVMRSPSVWLPWSASHKEFYPIDFSKKILKIGFAGTCNIKSYPIRHAAINKLKKDSLLINYYKVIKKYPNVLRRHIGMLSSAEMGGLLHAKAFEIMASGTVPLVNNFKGENILFENKKCYIKYKNDVSDISSKAKWLIKNKDAAKQMSLNAREEIVKRHTDEIRIQELYGHLKNMIEGKELERKWG